MGMLSYRLLPKTSSCLRKTAGPVTSGVCEIVTNAVFFKKKKKVRNCHCVLKGCTWLPIAWLLVTLTNRSNCINRFSLINKEKNLIMYSVNINDCGAQKEQQNSQVVNKPLCILRKN